MQMLRMYKTISESQRKIVPRKCAPAQIFNSGRCKSWVAVKIKLKSQEMELNESSKWSFVRSTGIQIHDCRTGFVLITY